jgi:hypothetical protein
VQVDGRTVAQKRLFFFKPSVEKILTAVRESAANEAKG